MISKRTIVKVFTRIIAATLCCILGFVGFAIFITAYPRENDVRQYFERFSTYKFPGSFTQLYARGGFSSMTDEGPMAMEFIVPADEIEKILNASATWPEPYALNHQWQQLENPEPCECEGCYNYSRKITVPKGAMFKRFTEVNDGNDGLLAVDRTSNTIFFCYYDT